MPCHIHLAGDSRLPPSGQLLPWAPRGFVFPTGTNGPASGSGRWSCRAPAATPPSPAQDARGSTLQSLLPRRAGGRGAGLGGAATGWPSLMGCLFGHIGRGFLSGGKSPPINLVKGPIRSAGSRSCGQRGLALPRAGGQGDALVWAPRERARTRTQNSSQKLSREPKPIA